MENKDRWNDRARLLLHRRANSADMERSFWHVQLLESLFAHETRSLDHHRWIDETRAMGNRHDQHPYRSPPYTNEKNDDQLASASLVTRTRFPWIMARSYQVTTMDDRCLRQSKRSICYFREILFFGSPSLIMTSRYISHCLHRHVHVVDSKKFSFHYD